LLDSLLQEIVDMIVADIIPEGPNCVLQ